MIKQRISLKMLAAALLAGIAIASMPVAADAIPRDTVVARGRVWVDRQVPYSQQRYATVSGDLISADDPAASSKGYRTDCSGFASLCYDLRRADGTPLSLDTASLPSRLDRIEKGELLPGDLILRPKNPAAGITGHAVVFVRWTNDARTHYVGIHQSSSAKGTVEQVIQYPFWTSTGFEPYRLKTIEDDFTDCLTPVSGTNRYSTAAAASFSAYPTTVDAVVLASGENWPDALGGAALAGVVGGPVLLTAPDRLSPETALELLRLSSSTVYILGGEASVSAEVARQVAGMTVQTVRLGGRNRYETAALIAGRVAQEAAARSRGTDEVYIASGENFPDALAAAPVAAAMGRPILLSARSKLTSETAAALGTLRPETAWILGGEAAIETTVAAAIAEKTPVRRLSAADRYGTAVEIARHGVSLGLQWDGVGIASGLGFPDALAGGAAQGAHGSVLLLTHQLWLPPVTASEVTSIAAGLDSVRVYGGTSTVTYPVRRDLAEILRRAQ